MEFLVGFLLGLAASNSKGSHAVSNPVDPQVEVLLCVGFVVMALACFFALMRSAKRGV